MPSPGSVTSDQVDEVAEAAGVTGVFSDGPDFPDFPGPLDPPVLADLARPLVGRVG